MSWISKFISYWKFFSSSLSAKAFLPDLDIMRVDGKNRVRNPNPLLHWCIETQVFIYTFLRVPGCPASFLEQDIMGKLSMVLPMG
jgi:hypothetical protein